MRRLVLALLVILAVPAIASAHPERVAYYPDYTKSSVPKYRTSGGKALVVCKQPGSRKIMRKYNYKGKLLKRNLRLLKRCRFKDIQAAVNAASSNDRIYVLPGTYREEPSKKVPSEDPKCQGPRYTEEIKSDIGGLATGNKGGVAKNYRYHLECPNSQNLIAIMGDANPDDDDPKNPATRACNQKCNLQIEGTGRSPKAVRIEGAGYGKKPGAKLNLIRADRADGIYLRNFFIRYSDFNNIYALETNGFTFDKIESGYSREYGFLSFASDNGLYDRLLAYGSGDSGIYPGSGPEGRCARYGIEIRRSDSHRNNLGYSGTAGNGVWAHDNKFHDNATGMATDSFAPNHPGMPQDCAKWENNEIYSNNLDLFSDERQQYCKVKNRPIEERDPRKVCSTFQVPTGTGLLIAGGNGNIFRNNKVWDNWRYGLMLHWVPAELRGEDPSGQSQNTGDQYDTSNSNQFTNNLMGVDPKGLKDPNGVDFWWDEEGKSNCWENNRGYGGAPATTDPAVVAGCPNGNPFSVGSPAKQAFLIPCAAWDPQDDTLDEPPGCDWMRRPAEPQG